MLGYRFLPAAEEEMIEASLFYEARSEGLGFEFLDGVQRLIDLVRARPKLANRWVVVSSGQCCNDFRSL